MSHYLGSKARHADQILEHVLPSRRPGQWYVEPFVGGANVLCRVPEEQGPRVAADRNKYMVALHRALGNGWEPPRLYSEADFNTMKEWIEQEEYTAPDRFPHELVGFVGCGCSFGSMWFSSFAKDDADKPAGTRCRQSAESCMRDAPGLRNVKYFHCDYDALEALACVPKESLWYCDPPYRQTTGYEGADQQIKVGQAFSENTWKPGPFWRWATAMGEAGSTVFVSEYRGPEGSELSSYVKGDDIKEMERRIQAHAAAAKSNGDCDYDEDGNPIATTSELTDEQAHNMSVEKDQLERDRSAASAKAGLDKWTVVWEKEVHVNVGAKFVTEARAAGNAAAAPKKETEKLFKFTG